MTCFRDLRCTAYSVTSASDGLDLPAKEPRRGFAFAHFALPPVLVAKCMIMSKPFPAYEFQTGGPDRRDVRPCLGCKRRRCSVRDYTTPFAVSSGGIFTVAFQERCTARRSSILPGASEDDIHSPHAARPDRVTIRLKQLREVTTRQKTQIRFTAERQILTFVCKPFERCIAYCSICAQ